MLKSVVKAPRAKIDLEQLGQAAGFPVTVGGFVTAPGGTLLQQPNDRTPTPLTRGVVATVGLSNNSGASFAVPPIGTRNADDKGWWDSNKPWGKRGQLPRVPRTVLITLNEGALTPAALTRTVVADWIDDNYESEFAPRNVSIALTNNLNFAPFVAGVPVAAANYVVAGESDHLYVVTDPTKYIGGDLLVLSLWPNTQFAFDESTPATYVNRFVLNGGVISPGPYQIYYGEPSGSGYVEGSIVKIDQAKADLGVLEAAAGRFRKFRIVCVQNSSADVGYLPATIGEQLVDNSEWIERVLVGSPAAAMLDEMLNRITAFWPV